MFLIIIIFNKYFSFKSCGRDKVIILWDLKSRKQLQTVALYDSLEAMIVLPAFFYLHSFESGSSSVRIDSDRVSIVAGGENGIYIVFNMQIISY